MVRLAFDIVEKNRAAAVQLLLNSGYFKVGINLFVALDQVTL